VQPGAGVARGERGDRAVDRAPTAAAQVVRRAQDAVVAVAVEVGAELPEREAGVVGQSRARVVTLRRTSSIRGSVVPGTSARIDPETSTATTTSERRSRA
jgi:hypothetical protein